MLTPFWGQPQVQFFGISNELAASRPCCHMLRWFFVLKK